MKKSQLREYIRNYINEIRLISGDKSGGLKVYKVGHKYILYILQTNGQLIFTVGTRISTNVVRFDEESEINKIKDILITNNIPYEEVIVPGSTGWSKPGGTKYIEVSEDSLNIIEKPVNTTVNQVDPEGDGWYYDMNINEIRLKSSKTNSTLYAFRDMYYLGEIEMYVYEPDGYVDDNPLDLYNGSTEVQDGSIAFVTDNWYDSKVNTFKDYLRHADVPYREQNIDGNNTILIDGDLFKYNDVVIQHLTKDDVLASGWYNEIPK